MTARRARWRRGLAAASAAGASLLLSGCTGIFSTGLYDVPLPGGADLGDHPFTVTVEFSDVLDLVPQSSVRVGNVAVGRVTKIALGSGGRSALVTVAVNGDVDLPADATATISQTSLLGEKYVDLARPTSGTASGRLGDGDRIPLSRTSEGVQVEQVFGALSLLLNGGGLEQIQTITGELDKATDGRTQDYRDLLSGLDTTITQLDARKTSITRALDSVNLLATNLRLDSTQIATVLDGIAPGLQTLARQTDQFVGMLDALNRLSTVTVDTLDASKDDIVADLDRLAPILGKLAQAGSALPQSLQVLLTYPFPDTVLQAIKGDYFSGFVVINLNTTAADLAASGTAAAGAVGGGGLPTSPGATVLGTTPVDPPPSLLPATSSASPGLPSATVVTAPAASGTAAPSGAGAGAGSGSASGSPTPTGSGSGSGAASGTPTGSASGSGPSGPSGTTSGGGS